MVDKEKGKDNAEGTKYSDASKKSGSDNAPVKDIHKVITTEVVVEKRGVGKKVRDIFVAADFKSVVSYVTYDVLIPAARNMIADTATKGVERMLFGESRFRRPTNNSHGTMARYSYQTPVNRDRGEHRDPRTRPPEPTSYPRSGRPDFFLQSRAEADNVLNEMYDILNVFEVVSVGDLNQMVGLPTDHTQEKWGWTDLRGVEVRSERAGWFIDLPKPEPI